MTHVADWTDAHRFWNDTPFRTYLFNAFSVLLPEGEAFIIDTMEAGAQSAQCTPALRDEVAHFVREERAHQRAHRAYNQQLARQGYNVASLEAQLAHALQGMRQELSLTQRLCLTAAFEHLTALVSQQALANASWLTAQPTVPSKVWQWHCAEEVAHHHIALEVLATQKVSHAKRVGWYVLASAVLCADIVRHMADFYRSDRQAGRITRWAFWASALGFVMTNLVGLLHMAGGWLRYVAPWPTAVPQAQPPKVQVRFLTPHDIDALMVLERKKWNQEQAASREDIAQRIATHPQLCIGAFSAATGEALASLFMKPITEAQLRQAHTWADCAQASVGPEAKASQSLFGISLSSVDPAAVEAMFEFFWPHALKAGWRWIYLGSPVPGLARWVQAHPNEPVANYVFATRQGMPTDPQLRYYWGKGFKHIVACKPNYFPHEASLDHGAVIRGRIPLSSLAPLWRRLPLSWLQGFRRVLFKVL